MSNPSTTNSYSTLSLYTQTSNAYASLSPCSNGTKIVPTYGTPPGYKTGYCNASSTKDNSNPDSLKFYKLGYQPLKIAYGGGTNCAYGQKR
jgi:hypothetical protein